MVTLWPSRPPLAFSSWAHRSYPWTRALPSPEKSPVRETETPIVIGVPAWAVPPVPPLLLPQAVRPSADTVRIEVTVVNTGLRIVLSNLAAASPDLLNKRLRGC